MEYVYREISAENFPITVIIVVLSPDAGEHPSREVLDLLGRQLERCGHRRSHLLWESSVQVWDVWSRTHR